MVKVKRITKSGAVTLTKDLRHQLGFLPGQTLDVRVSGDELVLRKHVPTCFFCGNTSGIVRFKGYEICENCRGALKNAGI